MKKIVFTIGALITLSLSTSGLIGQGFVGLGWALGLGSATSAAFSLAVGYWGWAVGIVSGGLGFVVGL